MARRKCSNESSTVSSGATTSGSRSESALETWLKTLGVDAVKGFCETEEQTGRARMHGKSKQQAIRFVLKDPDARWKATESMRIEREALAGRG